MYNSYEVGTPSAYHGNGRQDKNDCQAKPCLTQIPMQENLVDCIVSRRYDYGQNYRTKLAIQITPFSYVTIGFAKGNIDNYAVFIHCYKQVTPGHYVRTEAPWMRDFQLMGKFQRVAYKYNLRATVIHDFLQVFKHTGHSCDPQNDWVFDHLNELSSHYPMGSLMSIYFAVLHLSMISECKYTRQNRWGVKKSLLGKRVKFIGFYQALIKGWNSHRVANFSKHVRHNYLLRLYNKYRQNISNMEAQSPKYEYVR